MSRVILEWSWHCGMCMGFTLSPHKESKHLAGRGYFPPYEIATPSYDSDVLLAATLMKRWPHYARTQSNTIRCIVLTRDPLDRIRSHHTYTLSYGDNDLRTLGDRMHAANSTSAALQLMWDTMGRESMVRSHAYLTDALAEGCIQIPFEGFRNDFDGTIRKILNAWEIRSEAHATLIDIASAHDLGRLTEEEREANHHVTFSQDKQRDEQTRSVVEAIRTNHEIREIVEMQRRELNYDVVTGSPPSGALGDMD